MADDDLIVLIHNVVMLSQNCVQTVKSSLLPGNVKKSVCVRLQKKQLDLSGCGNLRGNGKLYYSII